MILNAKRKWTHTVQLFFGAATLRLFSHSVDQNSCWTEGQPHRSTATCHCIKRLHTDQRWSACVQMLFNLFGSNNVVLLQVQTHQWWHPLVCGLQSWSWVSHYGHFGSQKWPYLDKGRVVEDILNESDWEPKDTPWYQLDNHKVAVP